MSIESFEASIKELIEDNEDNQMIEFAVNRYFGNTNHIINNYQFCYVLLKHLIKGCLVAEESTNRWALDENQLKRRSQLIGKLIHNYVEYQLNLILVLASIKTELELNDTLFDKLIVNLHRLGIISLEAFNHWFKCNSHFQERVNAIDSCLRLLDWIQESREDYFFETQGFD